MSAGAGAAAPTFLFSDIEGSTRRWEADPETMAAVLARHDRILRGEVESVGGVVVKHTGDGCMAVFDQADDAITAAVGIQRSFAAEPVSVRIGLHTGPAEERDGDYFGPTVNRAARLMAIGHGGQILVSEATAALRRASPDPAVLVDLGEHRLRDLAEPERVHQVVAAGLDDSFPALRSVRRLVQALPVPRTSLVGRARAVEELVELVDRNRLVTLTGVGGTGKTRLAIAVVTEVRDRRRDGACFVDLSVVGDPDAVALAVAEAIGMPLAPGQSVEDDLGRFLADVDAVLVLDNCEHVIDGAADLADLLLERAPDLRLLATSREALGIEGERNWRVPSLATTDEADAVPAAAALFLERAAESGAVVDPAELDAVVDITERLDGIPLAVELAAARAVHLSPTQMLAMLDDRFTLLGGGRRRARHRQATLEATVDWSYDLLDETEQAFLRRLAVFAGSGTIEAIAEVCGDGSRSRSFEVLTRLVDQSLVVPITTDAGMRYRMLETIRLYAARKLVDAGESVATRDRHRDHVLAWSRSVARVDELLLTETQSVLEPEVDNLRAAIEWSLDRDRPDLAVRQVSVAAYLWFQSLRSDEAEAWMVRGAEAADHDLSIADRIAWRGARLLFAMERSDLEALVRWMDEVDRFDSGQSTPWGAIAVTIRPLVMAYVTPDDVAANLALVERARTYQGRVDAGALAYVEAHVLLAGGRFESAVESSVRGVGAEGSDPYWVDRCVGLGLLARHLAGDHAVAAELADRHLVDSESSGRMADLLRCAEPSVALAGAGELARARSLVRAQLEILDRRYAHLPSALGIPLVNVAVLLALDGRPEQATTLLGAVGARAMQTRSEGSFGLFRAYCSRLQADLGDPAFFACLVDSEHLSTDDLVAIAREVAGG